MTTDLANVRRHRIAAYLRSMESGAGTGSNYAGHRPGTWRRFRCGNEFMMCSRPDHEAASRVDRVPWMRRVRSQTRPSDFDTPISKTDLDGSSAMVV